MIYNDISKSNYFFKYKALTFYFSSLFYREKFIKEYLKFIEDETMKLKIKFRCDINCEEMILLLLYKKIEKRGFRVLLLNKELKDNYYIDCFIDNINSIE